MNEPLFCTWCGAEDYHCECRKDQDGHAFCETNFAHDWEEDNEGAARCRCCGMRAVVADPPPHGALRYFVKL